MSNGSDIAEEIRAGIAEGGAAVGDGPNFCVIKRNNPLSTLAEDPEEAETVPIESPIYFEAEMIEGSAQAKDRDGTLIGVVHRKLTIAATSVTPLKSDLIAVRTRITDVDANTVFEEIASVDPLIVGGVALLFKVMLKD
jgi:hypothetical protein